MKLLTYKTADSEPRLGFIHNNQVIDMEDFGEISNFPLPNDMLELINLGFEIIAEINEIIAETSKEFFMKLHTKWTKLLSSLLSKNLEKHHRNWIELYGTRC